MIRIRKSEDRGHVEHGWLDTKHTFSFSSYHDPEHMGFRTLRVINEDKVAGRTGFGTHPHKDMEIVTYMLDGEITHVDSMGNKGTISAGEVQRMTAGTGVTHSEQNETPDELHLLQIWILPEREGLEPGYEQRVITPDEKRGTLRLVASRDGRDGALTIHQDAEIWATVLGEGEAVEHDLDAGRHAWVQVARGSARLNGELLETGDGAAVSDESRLELTGVGEAELLVFDLA